MSANWSLCEFLKYQLRSLKLFEKCGVTKLPCKKCRGRGKERRSSLCRGKAKPLHHVMPAVGEGTCHASPVLGLRRRKLSIGWVGCAIVDCVLQLCNCSDPLDKMDTMIQLDLFLPLGDSSLTLRITASIYFLENTKTNSTASNF
ncbi:unnamed protein product [Calypogeia fissa]